MPQNFYEVLWIFIIYAFIGWCAEVSYAAVNRGIFVNRGFLNGPVCPIYGFGMVIVIYILTPVTENVFLLFFGSMILASALELVTGWALKKLFHTSWWDYSDKPFNVKGYICLEFTILWGLAAAFVVGAVHPFVFMLIKKTPFALGITLMAVCLALFAADLVITVTALARLPKKLNAMLEAERALKAISDKIGENISDTAIAAKEKGGELVEESKPRLEELKAEYEKKAAEYKRQFESRGFVHKRIFKAFPNLKSGRYKAVFERFADKKEKLKNEKDGV